MAEIVAVLSTSWLDLSNASFVHRLNDGHQETGCSKLLRESGAFCIEQNSKG
jgi:hypothetical protein